MIIGEEVTERYEWYQKHRNQHKAGNGLWTVHRDYRSNTPTKFYQWIARVQKELVENGNGRSAFTVDKVTVFSVNVTNAKAENVSAGTDATLDAKELVLPDKSSKILKLCSIGSHTKKEMLHLIGVTYQTANVRNIINPLIQAGCLAPIEDDKSKLRNVRFEATAKAWSIWEIDNP